ncbi:hypothetical protein AB6A40_006163 [Gnathostoma spinigerum]|uniref:Uncharacterized protein n=1 Tax=Gnathostoma spinigerum TaxID=75299 RepID=A0ABD6EHJ9_9BILA
MAKRSRVLRLHGQSCAYGQAHVCPQCTISGLGARGSIIGRSCACSPDICDLYLVSAFFTKKRGLQIGASASHVDSLDEFELCLEGSHSDSELRTEQPRRCESSEFILADGAFVG